MLLQLRPMQEEKVLSERIDRNKTKHQVVLTNCDRCGGAGAHEMWRYTGGTCYKCGGSGRMQAKRKIYTPEHAEKLRKQREKRAEKKLQERREKAKEENKIQLAKWGYHTGKIYTVLGDTYSIKEELKEKGAEWGGRTLGWYFSEKNYEYETVELEVSELVWYNDLGEVLQRDPNEYKEYVKQAKKGLEKESEWVYEVGEKIETELKILNSFEIETAFGWSCINKLADSEGNIFIWKTAKDLAYMYGEGNVVKIKGTVKELSEYREEKQTVLTRCKVIE